MRARTAISVVLVSIGAAGVGVSTGSPAGAAPSSTLSINERDTGKSFTLKRTTQAGLRLSGKWVWTPPKVRGRAIVLSPVNYRTDPGFSAWEITRHSAGTAKITAYGRPNCGNCSRRARWFSVTLKVR